jgi:hypothetical protein
MVYIPFDLSYEEFLSTNHSERDEKMSRYMRKNDAWFLSKLRETDAGYIVVSGRNGKVLESGKREEFPTVKDLEILAEKSGEVLFGYREYISSEEIAA